MYIVVVTCCILLYGFRCATGGASTLFERKSTNRVKTTLYLLLFRAVSDSPPRGFVVSFYIQQYYSFCSSMRDGCCLLWMRDPSCTIYLFRHVTCKKRTPIHILTSKYPRIFLAIGLALARCRCGNLNGDVGEAPGDRRKGQQSS